ncbi:MAG: glycyl-radical enzyme activating protein [Tannerella sp.]|jgi:pyruvate formate lyase activating enzyme|nr:glycyl-radical enzyme activating protein [Tannerella sp.]
MKGVIFDIKRFAVHDGPGIRVTAFLKGCPLACGWCHNPESRSAAISTVDKTVRIGDKAFVESETIGYEMTPEELIAEFRKERVFMEESGGGVTFSGGEPLAQADFLAEALALCKRENFHTAVDTSGFAHWDSFEAIIPYTDLFLYDLKLIDNDLHLFHTGVSNAIILENLERLSAMGASVRVRMPIIPEATLNDENISRSISFLKSLSGNIIGIDLLPFHNTAVRKYSRFKLENRFKDIKAPSKTDLETIKTRFETEKFLTHIGG